VRQAHGRLVPALSASDRCCGQRDSSAGQVSFSSPARLKLRLYYRLTTSKTSHAYKTTTVGSNGFFHFSEARSHGYYFKVVLPAQGAFRSCTSRTL
jgi:hypothetical protein